MVEKILRVIMAYMLTAHCFSAQSQSLDSILQMIVSNNPEIKGLDLEYQASNVKEREANQLPNTVVGTGIPVLKPETRLGPQVLMVGASQMFPWFGTLNAKKEVFQSRSEEKYQMIEAKRLELISIAKVSYSRLQFLKSKKLVIEEVIKRLQSLQNITLAKIEAGMTSSANVLRLQLKIDELDQMLKKLINEELSDSAAINSLTGEDIGTAINVEVDEELPEISFDLNRLMEEIKVGNPYLKLLEQKKQTSIYKSDLIRKSGSPTIGLGMDYSVVNRRTDMDPIYNGRDIFVPRIMLSFPLQRGIVKAKQEAERLTQEAISLKKEDVITDIHSAITKQVSDYNNAKLDIELAEKQIKTGEAIYQILLAEYSTEGKGFDDLITIEIDLLNYRLNGESAKFRCKTSVANIEKFAEIN
jgi:outer membrane protein TolC